MTSTCCPTSPGQSHPSYQEHTAKSEVSSGICQPPLVPQANNVQQFSGGSASSSFAPLGTGRVAYSTSSPLHHYCVQRHHRYRSRRLLAQFSRASCRPAPAYSRHLPLTHPHVMSYLAARRGDITERYCFFPPSPPLDASVPALQRQTVWLVKQDPAKCRTQEHVKGTS